MPHKVCWVSTHYMGSLWNVFLRFALSCVVLCHNVHTALSVSPLSHATIATPCDIDTALMCAGWWPSAQVSLSVLGIMGGICLSLLYALLIIYHDWDDVDVTGCSMYMYCIVLYCIIHVHPLQSCFIVLCLFISKCSILLSFPPPLFPYHL